MCALTFHSIPHMLHITINGNILNPEKRVCALINTAKSHPRRQKYVAISFHEDVPVKQYWLWQLATLLLINGINSFFFFSPRALSFLYWYFTQDLLLLTIRWHIFRAQWHLEKSSTIPPIPLAFPPSLQQTSQIHCQDKGLNPFKSYPHKALSRMV